MTQRNNDAVNFYYQCFRHMFNRQKKTMKHIDDSYPYNHMFIAGLKSKINVKVRCLSESLKKGYTESHIPRERLRWRGVQTVDRSMSGKIGENRRNFTMPMKIDFGQAELRHS